MWCELSHRFGTSSGMPIFTAIRRTRRRRSAAACEKRKDPLAKLLKGSHLSIVLNEHFEEDGAIVYREACKLGCEGIVSKSGSAYCSGRSPHWVKVKNPKAPAVTREAEEDWRK